MFQFLVKTGCNYRSFRFRKIIPRIWYYLCRRTAAVRRNLFCLCQTILGGERPDVDKIDGLSPVIAIEQRPPAKPSFYRGYNYWNIWLPASTLCMPRMPIVTIQEKMVSYSDEQIKSLIVDDFTGKRITILAP
jgi:excinuclease UvrABC ATPase subunit